MLCLSAIKHNHNQNKLLADSTNTQILVLCTGCKKMYHCTALEDLLQLDNQETKSSSFKIIGQCRINF